MKIRKIMPVFAATLLLVGCSNNGVTTMKKPSFAKYSNEVKYDAFNEQRAAKVKALMDLFETEGEGDLKSVKGLKNGFTAEMKAYTSEEKSGKSAGGLSMKFVEKIYAEQVEKIDKNNKIYNTAIKSELSLEVKNASMSSSGGLFRINDDKLLVCQEPNYENGSSKTTQKGKRERQNEISDSKVKQINVNEKTYDIDDLSSTYDFSKDCAQEAYYGMKQMFNSVEYYTDTQYLDEEDVKFYVDGDVFTVVGERAYDGTAEYNKVSYTSKAKVSSIVQVNFAKLTFASSNELTLEQSTVNGTLKYSYKSYMSETFTNKDVKLKQINTAKFVDLDA